MYIFWVVGEQRQTKWSCEMKKALFPYTRRTDCLRNALVNFLCQFHFLKQRYVTTFCPYGHIVLFADRFK